MNEFEVINQKGQVFVAPRTGESKFQYLFPFDGFDKITDEAVTQKEKEDDLEERLNNMGKFMRDADFTWRLDGAINISLILKKPIRMHKDIDINVDYADISKLSAFLEKKGFKIFFEDHEKNRDGKRCLERMSDEEIKKLFDKNKINSFQIAKIDNEGKIIPYDGKSKEINFIDLHISKKISDKYIVDRNGTEIPEKYVNPVGYSITAEGDKIPISHPVLVIYHKIWMDRDYDNEDIAKLKDKISSGDRQFLYTTLENASNTMIDNKIEDLIKIRENLLSQLNPDMDDNEIKNIISLDRLISSAKEHHKEQIIQKILDSFRKNKDLSIDELVELAKGISNAERVGKLKGILEK